MPSPYGSVANPVQQDPFQQIIRVHWKDQKDILAVAFAIRMQIFVATNEDGDTVISLRYWNPSDYAFSLPPLWWGSWVFDTEGWSGAPSTFNIEGLPPLGPAPNYDWTAPQVSPPVAGCRWVNPAGGAMDIEVPVIGSGETDHRVFQSGIAAIEDYTDSPFGPIGTRTNFPLEAVTVSFEGFDFEYAGAAAVPKVISGAGNTLIGGPGGAHESHDFELWVLCTRVTS